ncbi:MAG: 4Fe-4S dicluster domain-containing protein [Eubacteriales bacterium]
MRGLYTPVTTIRRHVFAEIAKLAYENRDIHEIEEIPYKIIPGEVAHYRDSVFQERAIIGERLRLAMGLSLRKPDEAAPISKGIEESAIPEKYYEPPLINVIPSACDACEVKSFIVSANCKGCLAHPCTSVCPVKAISIVKGKSYIDQEKCIKCGRCKEACPYDAITKRVRPCAAACGVDAIESDYLGRAKINYDKCVSCGMCMVNCPFAAIADKSQIFQLIRAMQSGREVIAAIAPAFVGQFGPLATPDKIKEALKILGFAKVYEVALGADMGAMAEAKHYAEHVPNDLPFLLTSCCPSWSMLAKKFFPDVIGSISNELTPMVATARYIKEKNPNASVVFIGPCAAKKLEASRRTVRSDVDFVITFEELMGMFVAKGIEFADMEKTTSFHDATGAGRGYGVAGGVASAIEKCIKEYYPDKEVLIDRAEGLKDCKKLLTLAKAGKRNGYLIEGMGCPGGCVGGAGTILPINKAAIAVNDYVKRSTRALPDPDEGEKKE